MKLKGFEGTPQEFADIVQNHGFEPKDFLEPDSKPSVHPVILFFLLFIFILLNLLICLKVVDGGNKQAFIVATFALAVMIAVALQIKYDKWIVSVMAFVGSAFIMSVSLGYITSKDAIEKIQKKGLEQLEKGKE